MLSPEIAIEFAERIKQGPDLNKLPADKKAAVKARIRWLSLANRHQIPPAGDNWAIWLLLAGRGAGKTRTAAEWTWWEAWTKPRTRWLVSAPTSGDLRDVCFEGDSGLLNVMPSEIIENYSRTLHELKLINGSLIKGIPASEPERFRGPQFHGGWTDELAAWDYLDEAWDMMQFGMRLGSRPQIVSTTTPKPKPLIISLANDRKDVAITRASTYDNIDNLAPSFRNKILQYEGTKLGRQEIHAEILDLEEGGVIRRDWFQLWPHNKKLPEFEYIVMSLDTAFTEMTMDKKSRDPDYTACSVWGQFRNNKKPAFLLLDCWQDRLGMPDLIARVKKEFAVRYGGEDMKPMFAPMIGSPQSLLTGRSPDILIIEEKGSGISLRQMLAREDIIACPYNPGRADKLTRLHMVSHLFAHEFIWAVESEHRPGKPKTWSDPLIAQLCTFQGEGSIKHDDFVDSVTQALRFMADRAYISITSPRVDDNQPLIKPARVNPYAV